VPDPLASIPAEITAGETVQWYQDVDSEYAPGGSYGVHLYLSGASVRALAAAEDEGRWLVTLPAAGTTGSGTMTPGTYEWIAYAVTGTGDAIERRRLGAGVVTVLPNLVTAAAGDRRSHAERALPLLEQQYRELAATKLESYTIAQRQGHYRKLAELRAEIAAMRAEIARARNGGMLPAVQFAFRRFG
jgi:hypothetical protein